MGPQKRKGGPKVDDEDDNNEETVQGGGGVSKNGKTNGVVGATSADDSSLEEWAADGPTKIVRKLAMYRFVLFMILVYEYATYLPHSPTRDPYQSTDTWFTYDQFEFLTYQLAPRQDDPVWGVQACALLYFMGIGAGICAALGGIPNAAYSFEFTGTIILGLYAFRFLAFVPIFTNHNYLFMLLAFLLIVSGGGSYYPPRGFQPTMLKNIENEQSKEQQRLKRLIQKSEWGAVMIRIQYAVVYFFASLWKITPHWIDGTICKQIFLSFQEQGVNRGVPWSDLYTDYGDGLFKFVAFGGLVLDTGMFLALSNRRPSQKSTTLFSTLSVLFHGFVCFTMSQRIGYTFPTCCMAGSLIFQPIGRNETQLEIEAKAMQAYAASKKNDDAKEKKLGVTTIVAMPAQITKDEGNLMEWIHRYLVGGKKARASPGQRYFALFWTLFQLAMPLRMPVISRGSFPYTSIAYRFSWTMMLHSRYHVIVHTGKHPRPDGGTSDEKFAFALELLNLYPECADLVPIQRKDYAAASIYGHADPRTLPLLPENSGIIEVRQRALIDQFPRHVARVGGGFSENLFNKIPDGCVNPETGERRPISVYGVTYTQLNAKGAFCRTFDPTVNLAEAERARKQRTVWQTIQGVLLDQGPPGYEYLLTEGMGSLNHLVEGHKRVLEKMYPGAKRIEFIADRAACLSKRPLTLWPNGFPLAAVVLEMPDQVSLQLSRREVPPNTTPDKQWDALTEPVLSTMRIHELEMANANMIEFSTKAEGLTNSFPLCGTTTKEDTLLALLFMA